MKKTLFALPAIACLTMILACGDDSSESTTSVMQDQINPSDSTNVDSTSVNPGDSLAVADSGTVVNPVTPTDSTADSVQTPAFSIPEEAAEITPALTIEQETGKGLLLDDFEDGDKLSLLGEMPWYYFDDNTDAGNGEGASIILVPEKDGESVGRRSDNGTKYSWAVYFNLQKGTYKYDPYVGWGVQLPDSIDYGRFGGFTYWYKGYAHSIRFETSDVADYDFFLYNVKTARAWTKVTIRFKDLMQGGWGDTVNFVPSHLTAISFQASKNGIKDSVLIDNLYLQDSSEVAPDTADMEINDPEYPETEIGDIAVTNPLQAKAMKYLDKGINFTNWLEEDTKFDGTFKFKESDVELMASNGIKGLRFPIDLDHYATNRDEYVAGTDAELVFDDEALFTVLDSFVEWTGKRDMGFVIDYHEYDNGYCTATASNAKYVTMMANVWKHVAEHYAKNSRESIFFELLNEPDMTDGKVTTVKWHAAAQEIVDSIRTVDKIHSIIFGDAKWYSISLLAKSTPLNDDNVIYAVHTYDPFVFTHQGASWAATATIKNLMFPYDKEKWSEFTADFGVTAATESWVKEAVKGYYKTGNKEYILSVVYPAKKWAVQNNVPVIINEFGAYAPKSDAQSVLNYMAALRDISDTLEIPLMHWGYTGGFALFENGALITGMQEAYGLDK